MGYTNLARGHQRLHRWLTGARAPVGAQLKRIADACAVAESVVQDKLQKDVRRAQALRCVARARDPRYYIVVRWMAAVYGRKALPEGLTDDEALELARDFSRSVHRRCCLDAPDGSQVWLDDQGSVYHVSWGRPPSMRIGRQRFLLAMD